MNQVLLNKIITILCHQYKSSLGLPNVFQSFCMSEVDTINAKLFFFDIGDFENKILSNFHYLESKISQRELNTFDVCEFLKSSAASTVEVY